MTELAASYLFIETYLIGGVAICMVSLFPRTKFKLGVAAACTAFVGWRLIGLVAAALMKASGVAA